MALTQQYQSHRIVEYIILGLIFFALSACANNDDMNESESAGLALPQLVQRMTIPSDGTLSATVTIDKDTSDAVKHNMQVDISNKRLNFSGDLSSGIHSFFLELYYNSPTVNTIRLVSASQTINITGDKQISFVNGDYIYDDRDSDSFTNIVEIESSSDPFSANSIPNESVADDNYEPNDDFASAYDLSSHRGAYFNDFVETNTGSGRLTLSDNVDFYKITTTDLINTIELEMATDYGLFWTLRRLEDGQELTPHWEFTLDEDIGYIHQKAVVTTTPAGDYYLIVFTPSENVVKGTYSFGWN